MKTSTSKTKTKKQYRFLWKHHVKDPLTYIKHFYTRNKIEVWQEQTYVFLSTGSVYKRNKLGRPFFIYKNLICHIECAHILWKRGNSDGLASRLLEAIFSCSQYKHWIVTFDELLRNVTDSGYAIDEENYNRYLINYVELFYYLNSYFYLLMHGEEQHLTIPLYVFEQSLLTDEEQGLNLFNRIKSPEANEIEIYPPFLSQRKVRSPFIQLERGSTIANLKYFFDMADCEQWQQELKLWHQALWQDRAPDQKSSSTHFLYSYTLISNLLDMYFELSDDSQNAVSLDEVSMLEQVPPRYAERKDNIIRFHYVKETDLGNPLQAVLETVKRFSKTHWEEVLYDWLNFGLSHHSISEVADKNETIVVYQLLNRIIELSYILAFEDELEFTNTKQ